MAELTLSAEQQAVFELIETTRDHIFVTGRAGTGKSTLLNHLSWNTEKQIVICAPTGVAALNVGGQTIHSLFRLPIGVIADHDIEQSGRAAQAAVNTSTRSSSTRSRWSTPTCWTRSTEPAAGTAASATRPFGGAQVVLFGDPYQLAPVPGDCRRARRTSKTNTARCGSSMRRSGGTTDLTIYELSTIHRQHEDEFKFMLNAVRHGVSRRRSPTG